MAQNNTDAPWYVSAFGHDYLEVYKHRDEEAARKEIEFAEKITPFHTGDLILDLCCGTGRHSLELARRGYRACCLDLSTVMLQAARRRAAESTVNLPTYRADARNLPFLPRFDVVVSLFTSFGYFEDDIENQTVINEVHRVLKPQGRFFLDYLNPDYVISTLRNETLTERGDLTIVEKRWYDTTKRRINKKITVVRQDDWQEYLESVRTYDLAEMERMIANAGLQVRQVFGSFTGEKFTPSSQRMILVGEKP